MSQVIQFRELVRDSYVEDVTHFIYDWLMMLADWFKDTIVLPVLAAVTTYQRRKMTVL